MKCTPTLCAAAGAIPSKCKFDAVFKVQHIHSWSGSLLFILSACFALTVYTAGSNHSPDSNC
eukprot:1141134-Pelagomonas_calceolata.AAC.1